ncbi:MAG: DUF2934 domain-containing protein [Terracidiphilus sp.]
MEEKGTKARAPRKPRAAAAKKTEPKEAAPKKRAAKDNLTQMKASHEQIAQLAHRFWMERGNKHGSDAEDWFRAEQELRGKAS